MLNQRSRLALPLVPLGLAAALVGCVPGALAPRPTSNPLTGHYTGRLRHEGGKDLPLVLNVSPEGEVKGGLYAPGDWMRADPEPLSGTVTPSGVLRGAAGHRSASGTLTACGDGLRGEIRLTSKAQVIVARVEVSAGIP